MTPVSIDSSQSDVKDTVNGTSNTRKGRKNRPGKNRKTKPRKINVDLSDEEPKVNPGEGQKTSARRVNRINARRALRNARRVHRINARKGGHKIDVRPSNEEPVVMLKDVKDYTEFLKELKGVTLEEELENMVPLANMAINPGKGREISAHRADRIARRADRIARKADRINARMVRKIKPTNGHTIDVDPLNKEPCTMLKDIKDNTQHLKEIGGVKPEEDLEDTLVPLASLAINPGKGCEINTCKAQRINARRARKNHPRKNRKINDRKCNKIDVHPSNEEPWVMLEEVEDHTELLEELEGVTPEEELGDVLVPLANTASNLGKDSEIDALRADRINARRARKNHPRKNRKMNARKGHKVDKEPLGILKDVKDNTEYLKETEGVSPGKALEDMLLVPLANTTINPGKGRKMNARRVGRIARRADRIARKINPCKGHKIYVNPSNEEPGLMLNDVKDHVELLKEVEGVSTAEELGDALVPLANMAIHPRKGRKISARKLHKINARKGCKVTSRKGPKINVNPSDEELGALLNEVKDHTELLKEFKGVIPEEELAKRKRALSAALPSDHMHSVVEEDVKLEKLASV